MKRLLIVFMLFLSFSLFATNPVTDHVNIKGYYEESESNLVFKVWKSNTIEESGRVYHAGDIYLEDNPTAGEVRIFTWELSGNKNLNILLTFTITPLQAYSHGTYYIPKHTLKMYENNTLVDTHAFSNATSGSSSYPGYRQSNSGSGSFIIKSAVFSFNESITADTPKTGHCTLQVLAYNEDTAGSFDYVSYVTVEFSTT